MLTRNEIEEIVEIEEELIGVESSTPAPNFGIETLTPKVPSRQRNPVATQALSQGSEVLEPAAETVHRNDKRPRHRVGSPFSPVKRIPVPRFKAMRIPGKLHGNSVAWLGAFWKAFAQ